MENSTSSQGGTVELGVRPRMASNTAGSSLGPWYLARAKALSLGFPMLTSNRLVFPHSSTSESVTSRTAVYGPVRTVVWQGSVGDRRPYADLVGFPSVVVSGSRVTRPQSEYRRLQLLLLQLLVRRGISQQLTCGSCAHFPNAVWRASFFS